jgi:hypothetical protein
MNELLPIVRRKRRPLLPVESLHDLPLVTTGMDKTKATDGTAQEKPPSDAHTQVQDESE